MRKTAVMIISLSLSVLTACQTGVEGVRPITDRDVSRTISKQPERQHSSLVPYVDSLSRWQPGKKFCVVDDRARLLFESAGHGATTSLAGQTLYLVAIEEKPAIDKSSTLIVVLRDSLNNQYRYNTGRSRDEVGNKLVIPMLVDCDMVEHYNRQLAGKRFFVLTSEWRDVTTSLPIDGRQFVPVLIRGVEPGNEVYPLRVVFTDELTDATAMTWVMTDDQASVNRRDFDSQFALEDPHIFYRHIRDDVWQCIIAGKVREGMTREECRLALGQPRDIVRLPDHGGLHENWYYDGGRVLRFSDGILNADTPRM